MVSKLLPTVQMPHIKMAKMEIKHLERHNFNYSSISFFSHIRNLLILVFFTDVVFGGSLGFMIYGVRLRGLLALILIGSFLASLIVNPLLKRWQLILLFSVMFVILVWGLLVPSLRGVNLTYSIAEASPLVGLTLALPLMQAFKKNGVIYYLDFINWSMTFVSFVIIFVWILANFFDSPEYAFGLKQFYLTVSGGDFGMYIGPMPDGSFRVMWITCLLLPFLLIYKNFNSFRLGWSIYYIAAIYATGTRSFLYVALLIFTVSLYRHRRMLFKLALPIVITVLFFSAHMLEGIRLFELASEFDSESPRFEQFFSLVRLLADFPLMGSGFGSQADILRSDAAPYSYELTYVALLAKLGSLGFIGFLTLLFFLVKIAFYSFPEKKVEILLILFSLLFITSTNPYLINFIGITIVSFLIAVIFYQDWLGGRDRSKSVMTVKVAA
jgi:hypothetical protein